MKVIIDIPEYIYKVCQGHGDPVYGYIAKGTPLPEGAEILTKEAYSDLCMRAAERPEKRTEKRTETHSCVCGEEETHEKRTDPCGDCISRQAALDCLVWRWPEKTPRTKIMELPSVEPERKTGHWIPRNSFLLKYRCSECGRESEKYDYCPNCVARMVEPQESEDKA